ncbi:intradiol ring-cleavage dioxygenase [Aureisphaera galaxeae]|uniref:dioxygenase family protein n=1 Tax=Aureisphaera galaxeae TaxID=1538023 RepID=UPI002350A7D5|nr:intradiol ring-cleavage dioxygenase [Aureisphaera galaxeae]MDC8003867.1 intradiol ring-cleavage dioxygenase [Aureisphaera galaxeae]
MRTFLGILLLAFFAFSCKGQSNSEKERNVGGPCEDCESLLDYKMLDVAPESIDTLPGFHKNEPKIKITGTVFKKDGKTPAENILLYVYHVDRNGIYQPSDNPVGWERRHGQHRGWLKTDPDGTFVFYTFRPAPYPQVNEPEHIHVYVKEPGTIPYYLDSYLFESDPTLTEEMKQSEKNRGGSGIVRLEKKNGIWTAHRNIILGLNIPDYD